MTIGQVWFGWAARGAEGVNQFQIIAASGALGDRGRASTQTALLCCRRPSAPGFGWYERDGLRVVFSRTPTGVDGRGRPGNFFVHVLIGRPSSLPTRLLPRLLRSPVWADPPQGDDVPARLEPFGDLGDIELGPAPELPSDAVAAFATHLDHTRSFRSTALAMPDEAATAVAGTIVRSIPAKFGLVSFATATDEAGTERYPLVGGPPRDTSYGIGTEAPTQASLGVAAMLIAAADGDGHAGPVVQAVTDRATTVIDLVDGLAMWGELTDRPSGDSVRARQAFTYVGADTRLAAALVAGSPALVARGLADGNADALRFAATTSDATALEALQKPTVDALRRRDPAGAAAALLEMARYVPSLARPAARSLLETWVAHDQDRLIEPAARARLLEVISAASSRMSRLVDALLDDPRVAEPAILSTCPVKWRALAFRRHLGALSDRFLVGALTTQPDLARAVVVAEDHELGARLEQAFRAAGPGDVRQLAKALGAGAALASDLGEWEYHSVKRLQGDPRFLDEALQSVAVHTAAGDWGDLLVDAAVRDIRDGGIRPLPSPRPFERALRGVRGLSDRATRFGRLAYLLSRLIGTALLTPVGAGEVIDAARSFADNVSKLEDALAAWEWVVDGMTATAKKPDHEAWVWAIGRVARYGPLRREVLDAAARAVWRRDGEPLHAAWILHQDAVGVVDGSLDPAVFESPLHRRLGGLLNEQSRVWVEHQADTVGTKPAARWLIARANDPAVPRRTAASAR